MKPTSHDTPARMRPPYRAWALAALACVLAVLPIQRAGAGGAPPSPGPAAAAAHCPARATAHAAFGRTIASFTAYGLVAPRGQAVLDERLGRAFLSGLESDHSLTVVDTRTGAVAARLNPPDSGGELLLDPARDRVFDLYDADNQTDAMLLTLDARTGGIVHSARLAGFLVGSAAIDEGAGLLYVISFHPDTDTTIIRAFDTTTGVERRAIPFPHDARTLFVAQRTGYLFVAGDLPGPGGLSSGKGYAAMVDPLGGAELWTVPIPAPDERDDTLFDERAGRLFVETETGTAVIDTRTGALVRSLPVTWTRGVVAEVAGRVFLSNYFAPTITMLDAATGRVLRAIATHPARERRDAHPDAVDERAGRVYVVTSAVGGRGIPFSGTGSLQVLDARTGAVLRSVPRPEANPYVLAVDPARGRAIVEAYTDTPTPNNYTPISVLDVSCI